MPQSKLLVGDPRLDAADADLRHDVARVLDRFTHIVRVPDIERVPVLRGHPPREIRRDAQAFEVRVHHANLGNGDGAQPIEKTIDQLR